MAAAKKETAAKPEPKNETVALDMAGAIAAVTKKIGILGKNERNQFAKYNYVPIDKYYEIVPGVALEFGLIWKCTCTGWKIIGTEHVAFNFTFSLHNVNTGEIDENWQEIPIIHKLQGAQTTGSAMSYAEKLMMRTTFKIVTGEKDADAVDNRDDKIEEEKAKATGKTTSDDDLDIPDVPDEDVSQETEPPIEDVPQEETVKEPDLGPIEDDMTREDWEKICAAIIPFIAKNESTDELDDYWRKNKVLLSTMKANHEDLFNDLVAKFSAHKATLKEKA